MKAFRTPLILSGVFLLMTLGMLYLKSDRSDPADPPSPADPTRSPSRRETRSAPDFWDAAYVPDPGGHVPAPAIRPEDLGVSLPGGPIDPVAGISKAIAENDLPAIQSSVLAWFERDPIAARDWLASQPTLDDLQPAISYIANHILDKGDLPGAIEWANILTDPVTRETTLFDIQALALRNQLISSAEISTNGLSPERIRELMSGAAGD